MQRSLRCFVVSGLKRAKLFVLNSRFHATRMSWNTNVGNVSKHKEQSLTIYDLLSMTST